MQAKLGNWISRHAILTGAAVLVLLIGWWILHHRVSPSSPSTSGGPIGRRGSAGAGGGSVPVIAEKVAQKDMPLYLDGLGTVQAFNTVTVHTRVDGQLDKVLFFEGQDVKTGDLLAVLDQRPYPVSVGWSRRAPRDLVPGLRLRFGGQDWDRSLDRHRKKEGDHDG